MPAFFTKLFLIESIVVCVQFKDVFSLANMNTTEFSPENGSWIQQEIAQSRRYINSSKKWVYCFSSRNMSNVMEDIMKNSVYDVHTVPTFDMGKPLKIKVALSVLAFRDVKEVDMTYTVDFFLRTKWIDQRLRNSLDCILTMTMGKRHPAEVIWVPDTMIENSVTSNLHEVLTNNHKINISPKGEVFWSTRVTVKAMCNMNLLNFPRDKQTCSVVLLSYAYPEDLVLYEWEEHNAVDVMNNTLGDMSQFDVTSYSKDSYTLRYVAGDYSILKASFVFERRLRFYIIQAYLPCVFLVILAGLSFWVDVKATAARVALGLTTLLTISTIWAAANSNMPPVNYVKAIDIYFLTSFCFVLATLLEYVAILNYDRFKGQVQKSVLSCKKLKEPWRDKDDRTLCSKHGAMCVQERSVTSLHDEVLDITESHNHHHIDGDKKSPWKMTFVTNIDKIAKFVYPTAYIAFNLVYWFWY